MAGPRPPKGNSVVPDGWTRQPPPASYAGRPGAELWKQYRVRWCASRAFHAVRTDIGKHFGEQFPLHVLHAAARCSSRAGLTWCAWRTAGTNPIARQRLRTRDFRLRTRGTSCCFFGVDNHFRQTWDIMQVLLLLYVAISVPFREGFDGAPWHPLEALEPR